MNVDEFVVSLRYDLQDADGTKYSDYQVLDALNKILRLVNQQLCNMSSDLIKVKTDLTLTSGNVSLPADFQAETRVLVSTVILIPRTTEDTTDTATYEIYDGKLYANQTTVTLTYKKSFSDITAISATALPLPNMFVNLLIDLIKQKLSGAVDAVLTPIISQELYKLVAKRGKANSMLRAQFTI